MKHYTQVFKPTEVQMMLAAFSNMETVHISAYSHLLDTIGMPETEYSGLPQIQGDEGQGTITCRSSGVETKETSP
jgi:ribonucleoside-diphosphate reductase beta chain